MAPKQCGHMRTRAVRAGGPPAPHPHPPPQPRLGLRVQAAWRRTSEGVCRPAECRTPSFFNSVARELVLCLSMAAARRVQVVSREEAVARIRAACDARDEGANILIAARSDSRSVVSLDEALWRAQAFADEVRNCAPDARKCCLGTNPSMIPRTLCHRSASLRIIS